MSRYDTLRVAADIQAYNDQLGERIAHPLDQQAHIVKSMRRILGLMRA